MNSSFLLTEMTIDDIKSVRYLWKKVDFDLSYSDKPVEIQRMIDHNPDLCLVIKKNSRIIASLLGGFDGRRGWIHHLAVDPDFQNNNYGTLMMNEITKRFSQKGVVKLKIEILEDNKKVIDFYKSLGWELRSELTTMSLTLKKL